MKILYTLVCACLFLISSVNYAMENKTKSPSSPYSLILSSLHFIGTLALEIVSFNPETPTPKKTHTIYPDLTIHSTEKVTIEQKHPFLVINGNYYDSNLTGKFKWQNGDLINKKGNIIDPLV